jgi:hypothetical protein
MHRKRVAYLVLVLCLALLVPAIAWAEGPVEGRWTVAPRAEAEAAEITVGDPVRLVLEVTHPAGSVVLLPQLEAEWGDLNVYGQSPPTTETHDDGTATTRQEIDARLFAPGTFSTPPLAVTVSDSGGQLTEVDVAPASITVSSVLVEGDTSLRDIKPQVDLPFTALWPWLVGGLLVAAAVGGFLFWRRRRQARGAAAVVDNRPPHQVALDQLAHIAQQCLPDKGRFKEHYTLLSDCMRVYVEQRYDVPVLERTTTEVWTGLERSTMAPDVARRFMRLLAESDLVKFARVIPDAPSAYRVVEQARDIVLETRPVGASSGAGQEPTDSRPSSPELAARQRSQRTEVTA